MKKKLTLITILLLSLSMTAKDYYVSTSGNDNNAGTLQSPFRNVQKAADLMSSGDVCYILGGTYREEVTVKSNNVTFQNYQNQNVTISGADLVTRWTNYKNGIFQANFSGGETQFTMLFAEGKHEQMARWPDNKTSEMMDMQNPRTGYAKCNNKVGRGATRDVSFFDNELNNFPVDHWKGGIFRQAGPSIRNTRMGIVASSRGKNLKVTPKSDLWLEADGGGKPGSGNGFGFIFHLNALNRAGEWFAQNDKIYYKPRAGVNPNNISIEAKKRKWAFKVTNKTNVTIKGINIKAASLEFKQASNCKVLNCSVKYLYPFVIRTGYGVSYTKMGGIFVNGNNNKFKDCYIGHSWGNGFSVDGGKGNVIENCLIEDIGWVGLFTSSIQNRGFETQILHNTFGSSGRFHVRTDTKVDMLYNDLYDCMKMGQDAGSIQVTNGGRRNYGKTFDMQGAQFAYNKIHDSNTIDWDGKKQFVLAFYFEGCSNYTIHHNLIYNIKTDVVPDGTFTYLGPRYATVKNAFYYNNTIDNVDFYKRVWNRTEQASTFGNGTLNNVRFWNNLVIDNAQNSNLGPDLLSKINTKNEIKFRKSELNTIFANANTNDYRLKRGSRAIDKGVKIAGVTDDFSGSAPDVGCFELGKAAWVAGSTIKESNFDKGPRGASNNVISLEFEYPVDTNFAKDKNVFIKVNASSSIGDITKVEFYDGSRLLITKTVDPYQYSYRLAPVGNRNIRVIAYDDKGNSTKKNKQITVGNNARVLTSKQMVKNDQAGLFVYPTPSSTGEVNFMLNEKVDNDVLVVYDINGRNIFEEQLNNTNKYKLDTQHFAKGVYLFKFLVSNTSGKFVIE